MFDNSGPLKFNVYNSTNIRPSRKQGKTAVITSSYKNELHERIIAEEIREKKIK